jgi:preprotein translocase subunit SecF
MPSGLTTDTSKPSFTPFRETSMAIVIALVVIFLFPELIIYGLQLALFVGAIVLVVYAWPLIALWLAAMGISYYGRKLLGMQP